MDIKKIRGKEKGKEMRNYEEGEKGGRIQEVQPNNEERKKRKKKKRGLRRKVEKRRSKKKNKVDE